MLTFSSVYKWADPQTSFPHGLGELNVHLSSDSRLTLNIFSFSSSPHACTHLFCPLSSLSIVIIFYTQEDGQYRLHFSGSLSLCSYSSVWPMGIPGLSKKWGRKRSEYLFLDSQLREPLGASPLQMLPFFIPLTSLSLCVILNLRVEQAGCYSHRAGPLYLGVIDMQEPYFSVVRSRPALQHPGHLPQRYK